MRFYIAILLLYPFFLAPAFAQPSDSVPVFASIPDANAMRQSFSREMAEANAGVREASANLAEARRELAAATTAIDEAGDAIAAQYTEIGRLVASLGGRFPDEVAALNAAREAMVESPSRRSQARIDTAQAALARAVAGTPEGQSLAQARARLPQLVSALEAARERQEMAAELAVQHLLVLTSFQISREAVRERVTELFESWAPAHVVRVTVRGGGETYHEETWTDPDESELIELLRLADYIESDLEQLLARREERVEQFIFETQIAMEYADVRLEEYINWVGGNNPPGNWATFESLLDSTTEIVGLGRSGGALVTGGGGTWRRILLEIGDRGVTIGRDVASGLPPALSVAIELISQLHATANREAAWDVLRLPHNDAAVDGRHLETEAEWQRLEAINTAQLRAVLERMRAQLGSDMLDESYASRLGGVYQPRGLAVSMSYAVYRGTPPRLNIGSQDLQHVNRADWAFFEIGLDGTAKSVLKSTVEVALSRINRAAQQFADDIAAAISGTAPARAAQRAALRPWHQVVLTELALDYVQAQIVASVQRDIEFARVARWARYLEADMERLLSLTLLQNEGRIRRFEQRLLELIRETQEEIRVEIENQQSSRTHGVRLERALPEEFEIEVEFSHAVTVQSVRIGDLELETQDHNFGFSWSGRGRRDDIGEDSIAGGFVTLELAGYRSPDEADLIDGDSASVASLNTVTGAIDGYEQSAFRTNLRMEPPQWEAAYGIVLDTSGSMDGGRLASAQQALVDMFEFGLLNERTTASVTTFRGCSLSGSDYTNDFAALSTHIRSRTAGGDTPLASAIRTTARNLVLNADAERRYLIVMSDGEESCNGSVSRAMRYARDLLSGAEEF
ncbi:vWA domain-containing protein [Hyphobacterium sp.]|uniref:vWA domain-containing protein n=1 Tax=Hyphobacterium sp. TaxID=2004662 RepID=UPI003B5259D4